MTNQKPCLPGWKCLPGCKRRRAQLVSGWEYRTTHAPGCPNAEAPKVEECDHPLSAIRNLPTRHCLLCGKPTPAPEPKGSEMQPRCAWEPGTTGVCEAHRSLRAEVERLKAQLASQEANHKAMLETVGAEAAAQLAEKEREIARLEKFIANRTLMTPQEIMQRDEDIRGTASFEAKELSKVLATERAAPRSRKMKRSGSVTQMRASTAVARAHANAKGSDPMKRITVAGLRKLAERKGLDVEEHDRGHGKQVEIWWSGHMTHFATIHDSLDLEVCRRAAYGILNGMPDKPKDKKRGEGK